MGWLKGHKSRSPSRYWLAVVARWRREHISPEEVETRRRFVVGPDNWR